MISIVRRKSVIKIEEVWFSKRKSNDKKVDIISYCQTPDKFAYLNRQSKTLITDLTADEDKLLNDIHKHDRYKIRKAPHLGVMTSIYYSSDISNNLIEEFSKSYVEFMKEKKLPFTGNEKTLAEYIKLFRNSGYLAISTAEIRDKTIIYHVYIYDENITRIKYSTSHYRSDFDTLKNTVGMANRLLHYNDMLEFKAKGVTTYDWGGVSDEDEIQNISAFKRKFGGTEVDTLYVQEAVRFKGKLALLVKKILKKLI